MSQAPVLDSDIAAWMAARALDATAADASVAGMRAHSRATSARARALLSGLAPVADQHDDVVAGVPVRVLRPLDPAPQPSVIVFFHGGGWVIGDTETHQQHAQRLCGEVGAVVVSVDYRLAPEQVFPAAFDDCLAVTRWAASAFPGARVVVAGDSVGGQLAASVALACRDLDLPIAAQLLIYPVIDVRGGYADAALNAQYPSRIVNAEGYGLTLTGMADGAARYCPDGGDWRLSPLLAADLRGVAPAVVLTCGFDVLRDEGAAYVRLLAEAGVPVTHRLWPTLNHGCLSLGGVSAVVEAAARQATADLCAVLAPPG